MKSKFSHLIQAGAIIHTVDGGVYRCTSKIASDEGIKFRLADLQGKPVSIPANFRPVTPTLARFAAWMRLAYNKDFDLYVKEYIKAAGLPVDPDMNWSRFFQANVAPKLVSKDEEVRDEAIHHIIIISLAERNVLADFNKAIVKFPPHIQELPLDKQVTKFLMQTFNWRIMEANRYISDKIYQDQTSSMWQEGNGDDELDTNLLDTESYATRDQGYDAVDNDVDVQTFRRGFEAYLSKKFRSETVVQYLSLFDLLYAHLREGDIPRGVDIREEWEQGVGAGKSSAWFKQLFANLPKLIDIYVTNNLGDEEVNPFIQVMQNIGQASGYQNRGKQPAAQLVHASFGGLKLADEFPINHTVETAPSSGSSNSGGGGGMSLGDLGGSAGEAGEAAAGAGESLEALAPLAVLAAAEKDKCTCSSFAGDQHYECPIHGAVRKKFEVPPPSKKAAAQWEVPKCKSCGDSQSPTDCPACHEKFCGDCMLSHHANSPSHERLASKKAGILGGPADDFDYDSASNAGLDFVEEPGQSHVDISPEMRDSIADCMDSGLYDSSDEAHFSWRGCDFCKSGGADVYDCKGYRNLKDAQAPNKEELIFEFELCGDCLYKLVYGEE